MEGLVSRNAVGDRPHHSWVTSSAREYGRQTFSRLAGSAMLDHVSRSVYARRLRILAYHEVADPFAFEAQMGHLAQHYAPVSGDRVLAAVRGEQDLPTNAVWITFDDGYPSVVEAGQPILDRFAIPATMFVCPGVIDTDQAFWWHVVSSALESGIRPRLDGNHLWTTEQLITYLKTKPDRDRREFVSKLAAAMRERDGQEPAARQLRLEQVLSWSAAGHQLGNHTWDHPCLDRCTPMEQRRQIEWAHDWLSSLAVSAPFFAYPNGNRAPETERVLTELRYAGAVGYDHRVSRLNEPLHISRLRVSASVSLPRFKALVSGLHAQAYHAGLRTRLLGGGRTSWPDEAAGAAYPQGEQS